MQLSSQRALTLAGLLAFCVFTNLRLLLEIRARHNAINARRLPIYFAICAVVKDQNEDLREWVQYHQWLGAQKILLYDHASSPPAADAIADYVASGFVDVTTFEGHHTVRPRGIFSATAQGYAYSQCLERARGQVEWLAFIDIDEFLMLYQPPHRNISTFLRRYEGYGGVAVNWRTFGSSGHICRPRGATLRAFTACLPGEHINKHVKTIAHVPYTMSIGGTPHGFVYRPGHYAVSPDFRKCSLARCSPVALDRLVIHHYVLKSFQQYLAKLTRGGGAGSVKSVHHFHAVDRLATDTCRAAVRIASAALPGPEWATAPPRAGGHHGGRDGAAAAGEGPPCGLTPGDVRRITYQSRLAPLGTLLPPPWTGASSPPLPLAWGNGTAVDGWAPAAPPCAGGACGAAATNGSSGSSGNGTRSSSGGSSSGDSSGGSSNSSSIGIGAGGSSDNSSSSSSSNIRGSDGGGDGSVGDAALGELQIVSPTTAGAASANASSGSSSSSNGSSDGALVALERALKAAGGGTAGGMWASVQHTLSELRPVEGGAGTGDGGSEGWRDGSSERRHDGAARVVHGKRPVRGVGGLVDGAGAVAAASQLGGTKHGHGSLREAGQPVQAGGPQGVEVGAGVLPGRGHADGGQRPMSEAGGGALVTDQAGDEDGR